MKRIFAIILSLLIFVSIAITGCSKKTISSTDKQKENVKMNETGLPIVNQKITLKFVAPKAPLAPNYGDMVIFKRLEEKTNVHIDWQNIPDESYDEKKNLILASGDLPDAFYDARLSDYDIIKYGESGTLIPLEGLIDKYAPNLKKIFEERPDLKKFVTAPDGHIYTLPSAEEMGLVQMPNEFAINKKWLDKLGLPLPTTLEDLHKDLLAFKNQDPNGNGKKDEIPLSFMYNFWTGNQGDLFAAFGIPDNPDHRIVKNGKVIFTAVQPQYKEAIEYFHEWVKEGLIDPESFTQDSTTYLSKGKTKDETLGAFIWWEIPEMTGNDRANDYVLLPPLKGPHGDQLVGKANNSEYGRAAFAITKADKYPEITMRWVDQLYDPKMSAQIDWGPIGIIYKEDQNGMLVNLPIPKDTTMGEYRQKVAPRGVFIILQNYFGKVVDMEPRAKQRLNDIQKYYEPYMMKENYPPIFFNAEELDTINQLQPNILQFVNETVAKWLMTGGVDKEWDGYIAKLKQMGLDQLMKVYQDGLDRYNSTTK
jgi:putative aldouronate transport system substrate-binding protein